MRLVRFLYTDNGGVTRGKSTHVDFLRNRIDDGIGLTKAMQAMNMLDQLAPVEGMGPVGEIRLVPDPEQLPHVALCAPRGGHDGGHDRAGWLARGARARVRSSSARSPRCAQAGFSVQAVFEVEYSAWPRRTPTAPLHPWTRASVLPRQASPSPQGVIDDTIAALEAQGMQVDQYYPELGHGQQELPIRHAPALTAADNQVFFRETVRNVAYNHGLYASLAPKPFPEQAGNGAHIHFSLWDKEGRKNLMADPDDPYGLSRLGYYFIAGVLEHLPALLALTCPSYNSYRRLQPHFWSSAFTAWGPDNREGAIRVPVQAHVGSVRQHQRRAEASGLVFQPLSGPGRLVGRRAGRHQTPAMPGAPALVDPATTTDAERAAHGHQALSHHAARRRWRIWSAIRC